MSDKQFSQAESGVAGASPSPALFEHANIDLQRGANDAVDGSAAASPNHLEIDYLDESPEGPGVGAFRVGGLDESVDGTVEVGEDEILPHVTAELVTGDIVDRDSMRQEIIDQVRREMRENIPTAQVQNDSDNRDEEEHQSTSTTADEEKPPSWNKKHLVISAIQFLVASCLCSCSPTVFAFTLNFSAFCPGNLVDDEGNPVNDAIGDKSCFTTVVGGDSRNSQPIHVETVTIQELNMKRTYR
jgi:hypothetical protein